MIHIPEDFRPHLTEEYPPENNLIFEEWVYQNFNDANTERQYLPIFWTSYYVSRARYGKDRGAIDALQRFIDSLDKRVKYFTVLQYDDGILNDVSKLDLKVFGAGGGKYDYPLPLLCKPHSYNEFNEKTIFASFRGNYSHPIRHWMRQKLSVNSKFHVTDKRVSIDEYCKELSQSIFALCPRGYGLTSFRIMEAIQYGAIPVYISNDFIIPHNVPFYKYGVLLPEGSDIESALLSLSKDMIEEKQRILPQVWKTVFSYEATRDLIIANAH